MDKTYCPTCAEELGEDDRVWLVRDHFYCSETCARQAALA